MGDEKDEKNGKNEKKKPACSEVEEVTHPVIVRQSVNINFI